VIIDEAHNIINALTDQHSQTLTKKKIINCLNCVVDYRATYINKLKINKLLIVDQSIKILNGLRKFIDLNKNIEVLCESIDYVLQTYELDRIRFMELWEDYEEYQMPIKMHYTKGRSQEENKQNLIALRSFQQFLVCLSEPEGNFLIGKNCIDGSSYIRLVLLNPYEKFQMILDEANCVVLAGGTLQPYEEFTQLFHTIPKKNLSAFPAIT
jgi:chromosome transmission fidelity protein 1